MLQCLKVPPWRSSLIAPGIPSDKGLLTHHTSFSSQPPPLKSRFIITKDLLRFPLEYLITISHSTCQKLGSWSHCHFSFKNLCFHTLSLLRHKSLEFHTWFLSSPPYLRSISKSCWLYFQNISVIQSLPITSTAIDVTLIIAVSPHVSFCLHSSPYIRLSITQLEWYP